MKVSVHLRLISNGMRSVFPVLLMLSILLAGTYWYTQVEAVCKLPISYRIGVLDDRFGLTFDEARTVISDAESVWENSTGKNLFIYDETAEFAINYIFDERQAFSDAEEDFRDRLDDSENKNESIEDTYAELVSEYNTLDFQYKTRVDQYEKRLSVYNKKVERYNKSGGAPKNIFKELEAEKRGLDLEIQSLNELAAELNKLTSEINHIGQEGNLLVETYNRNVDVYNRTFGELHEFTQGDFQGDHINVYKFSDREEHILVLAHELGHTLSLDHVEGSSSIMYYLMGGQDELVLSETDLAEFELVCGEINSFDEWYERLTRWIEFRS